MPGHQADNGVVRRPYDGGMDGLDGLLSDAAGGDRLAFSSFVRATQADVWRFVAHLVDAGAADDLTQEVYLRVLRSAASFRGEASARTWLLAIARRVAADEIRRRQRQRRNTPAATVAPTVAPTQDEGHAGTLAVRELIAELEPDRRAAFVLTQVLGCPYAEAAAVLEVPVGTIRSRVARAREQLMAALSDTDAVAEGPFNDRRAADGSHGAHRRPR